MKLTILSAMFVALASTTAFAGQGCGPGANTPDVTSGMCHLYTDATTCQEFSCQWQVYNSCQPNDPSNPSAGFCKFETNAQQCLQSASNCTWIQ